jgi:hypothetical protein
MSRHSTSSAERGHERPDWFGHGPINCGQGGPRGRTRSHGVPPALLGEMANRRHYDLARAAPCLPRCSYATFPIEGAAPAQKSLPLSRVTGSWGRARRVMSLRPRPGEARRGAADLPDELHWREELIAAGDARFRGQSRDFEAPGSYLKRGWSTCSTGAPLPPAVRRVPVSVRPGSSGIRMLAREPVRFSTTWWEKLFPPPPSGVGGWYVLPIRRPETASSAETESSRAIDREPTARRGAQVCWWVTAFAPGRAPTDSLTPCRDALSRPTCAIAAPTRLEWGTGSHLHKEKRLFRTRS